MKKIILIMLLSLPFLMFAQTKAKYPQAVEKTVFAYMIMEFKTESITIKSPKKNKDAVRNSQNKKTNYLFTTNNKYLKSDLMKISASFTNEIYALNALGKMGWELIDVDNGKYYFRSVRR
jgi:hypothetical protein